MAKLPEHACIGNASAPPRAAAAAPNVTIAIPLDALPAVTVAAAPPALVSPDVGAEHVGLTRSALVDVLRAMRADPDFAGCVIVLSRKRVAASPEDVIRFLRARHAATCAPADEPSDDAPASGVDEVLSLVGAERAPGRARVGR
jgi:hypothetical protein